MNVIELTEGEKKMLTTGLIFSTSKLNPLFIKEGMDGGNYVCEAFIINGSLHLFIYDMSLETDSHKIQLNRKEVHRIKIFTDLQIDNDGEIIRASNDYNGSVTAYYTDPDKIFVPFKGDIDEVFEPTDEFSISCSDYEGLPLDTQAKRFFIDILNIYLKNKKELEDETANEVNAEETVVEPTHNEEVSPV